MGGPQSCCYVPTSAPRLEAKDLVHNRLEYPMQLFGRHLREKRCQLCNLSHDCWRVESIVHLVGSIQFELKQEMGKKFRLDSPWQPRSQLVERQVIVEPLQKNISTQ